MNITIELLEKWGSCYSREKHESIFKSEDKKEFTPLEIADLKSVPVKDRIWVLLHNEIIPEKELRLLACDFAENALKLIKNPDQRSLNAIAVSRRFANGEATCEELAAAWDAAWDAARAAAWDAARDAAWAAARAAARDAARDAARAAAWAAARDAAWDAAWDAQLKQIVMVLEELKK
jgi:hypothetical protein